MQPAAAHFANVAPHPNSTSSGWAPIASAERGTSRSRVHVPRTSASGGWPGSLEVMPARAAETRGWISGWVRSATVSRSSESSVSWRTVTRRPLAMARSRWWRNEPRPYEAGSAIAHGRTSTLVPSRRRSGTMTTAPGRASVGNERGIGRSPWLMITSSKPFPEIVSTPESTAPLSPRPGPHSTVAPSDSAHCATASSSHATNVGNGRTASMTRPAIQRASAARSAAETVGESLALADVERLDRDQHRGFHAVTVRNPRSVSVVGARDDRVMSTTGVAGGSWRADVTPWGAIEPWDGSPSLDWYVAADDRWHVPSREPAVRQVRLSGTAVVETRVRVPTGDAVQRVFSIADGWRIHHRRGRERLDPSDRGRVRRAATECSPTARSAPYRSRASISPHRGSCSRSGIAPPCASRSPTTDRARSGCRRDCRVRRR